MLLPDEIYTNLEEDVAASIFGFVLYGTVLRA
jgi:hypothetical protein